MFYRRTMAVFLLVAVIATASSFYGYYERERTTELDRGTKPEQSAEVIPVVVYVCGAVNKPGVVELDEGTRVIDAVEACGGLSVLADAQHINMAQLLKDGMQITVPEKPVVVATPPAENATGATAVPTSSPTAKVSINTATRDELDTLPGIGPSLAEAIVQHRAAEGAFTQLEDIMKVRGIGEAKFKKLQEHIRL